ncbi:hypothetical protein FQA47_010454 [Oryzias melastigma]|uniref:Uncharacterized protein n=1 Tax=Oryzias melastigma TaxID=30732 RepID=A0A834C3I8_ORYME|nr:hypothetical protein FQA47_010454 [Oryzias melastigma]
MPSTSGRPPSSSKSCSPKEDECLLLIESMSSLQDGGYECTSEEKGYRKVCGTVPAEEHGAGPDSAVWVHVGLCGCCTDGEVQLVSVYVSPEVDGDGMYSGGRAPGHPHAKTPRRGSSCSQDPPTPAMEPRRETARRAIPPSTQTGATRYRRRGPPHPRAGRHRNTESAGPSPARGSSPPPRQEGPKRDPNPGEPPNPRGAAHPHPAVRGPPPPPPPGTSQGNPTHTPDKPPAPTAKGPWGGSRAGPPTPARAEGNPRETEAPRSDVNKARPGTPTDGVKERTSSREQGPDPAPPRPGHPQAPM